MSYKGLFPTRTGTAIGGGGERTMLDRTGAGGFRKDFRTELDGSVTMLTTHGGMPRFQNFGAVIGSTSIAVTYTYMDTGNLLVEYPAPLSPTRLDPSKLSFIDIGTGSDYLGEISLVADTFGQQSTDQLTNRHMVEDMDSLAIGWKVPTVFTPPETLETWTAAKKAAMESSSVNKKIVIGNFPASLWTGKMRLFMQAQYGMPLEATNFGFYPDLVGTELVLKYRNTTASAVWQPGYWTHKSAGIFTAGNGEYFVIDITSGNPTIPGFACYSYEIKQTNSTVATVIKDRIAETTDPDALAKLEAYLFSLSHIDLSTQKAIGSYLPSNDGSAIAYGWKFDSTGSNAKAVVHKVLGTGYADLRWFSSTESIVFTYSEGTISMSASSAAHGEWTDGWGTFNIFAPESESLAAPLAHLSLMVNRSGVKPEFTFTNIPIYGYFKDDAWVPVKLSRTVVAGPFPKSFIIDQSGVQYTSDVGAGYYANKYQYGYIKANESGHYKEASISSGTLMDVQVGGTTYSGEAYSGTFITVTKTVTAHHTEGNAVSFHGYSIGGYPPNIWDHPEYFSAPFTGVVGIGSVVVTRLVATGSRNHKWTAVVPSLDAEAVYVSTYEADSPGTTYTNTTTTQLNVIDFGSWVPFAGFVDHGGWYGLSYPATTTSNTTPPIYPDVKVFAWNTKVSAVEGTPGGSYYQLFNVDYTYPFYDRGMMMLTSFGKRYVGSEIAASPASVGSGPRFIGWA